MDLGIVAIDIAKNNFSLFFDQLIDKMLIKM
jgi:hypothetical protein